MTPTCHGCGLECSPDDPRLCGFCRVPSGVDATKEIGAVAGPLRRLIARMLAQIVQTTCPMHAQCPPGAGCEPCDVFRHCKRLTEEVAILHHKEGNNG